MRRIVVTEFISLDGVVEDPGGAEGYKHGGWRFKFDDPDGMKYKLDETFAHDAMLLGRVTYEGFAEAWPSRSGDPYSDRFNGMPKYVVTSTLASADWTNSHIVDGGDGVYDRIRALREEQKLLVWGSPSLVQSLLREGLVDELVLLTSPVVLGEGLRLFADGADHRLRFTEPTLLGGGMLAVRAEATAG